MNERIEITRHYIEELRELIEQRNETLALAKINPLHPADIAEIYDELNIEEAKFLFLLLDGEKAAYVLSELEEDDRERFLKALPSDVIAKRFVEHMDSDDAADIIGELPKERKEEVLALIDDIEQAGDIVDLLNYDENTAGGMMAKELIAINKNLTARACIGEIKRQTEEVDEIYYVYVTDDQNKLLGTLPLKKLLIANDNELVDNICEHEIISVSTEVDSEEVARMMDKYNLVAIPVVDSIGRLMGRITIDDVVDIIREEAERDYQQASGLSDDVEPGDSVWRLVKARLPWLYIGLAGGVMGSRIIGVFEGELEKYASLAFFIPLVGAMGGNAGVQSSAIMVQALASNSLSKGSMWMSVLKEFSVAAFNAILLASTLMIYNFAFAHNTPLTISVSSALMVVIILASLMGTFVPLILNRMNIDPALATGPFITTANDIVGLFVYFTLGRIIFSSFPPVG